MSDLIRAHTTGALVAGLVLPAWQGMGVSITCRLTHLLGYAALDFRDRHDAFETFKELSPARTSFSNNTVRGAGPYGNSSSRPPCEDDSHRASVCRRGAIVRGQPGGGQEDEEEESRATALGHRNRGRVPAAPAYQRYRGVRHVGSVSTDKEAQKEEDVGAVRGRGRQTCQGGCGEGSLKVFDDSDILISVLVCFACFWLKI